VQIRNGSTLINDPQKFICCNIQQTNVTLWNAQTSPLETHTKLECLSEINCNNSSLETCMQLPRACHPPHTASAHKQACADVGLQSHPVPVRLLQRGALRSSDDYHQQTRARPEQCSKNCAVQMPKRTHAKPLLEKLHWLPVEQCISYKLAVLTCKVRSRSMLAYLNRHIHTSMRTGHSVISNSSAVRAIHQDQLHQAHLLLLGSSCLELPTHCVTLSTFKSKLKAFLFSHTFTHNSSYDLKHYINVTIIIII